MDYQTSALILGCFYSLVELVKWLYNRQQHVEIGRMLENVHNIVTVKDSVGRPVVYRDASDAHDLQRETVSEMRHAIQELGQLVRDTNVMLQKVLLDKIR